MKKKHLATLLFLTVSCNQPTHPKLAGKKIADTNDAPDIEYSVINASTDKGGQIYDLYLKDTSKIKALNSYLREKYRKAPESWIQINYFNDSEVAKTYFKKQFDNNISEKEKDRIFKFYIANYKYNPTSKYDSLVFEH